MKITGSVALVTGANRGIGRHFAQQLLHRGATKVYATARAPTSSTSPVWRYCGSTSPIRIRSPPRRAEASDVTLLINNAGVFTQQNLVTGDPEKIRLEMDTNYFGTLNVVRAFTPVLAANGGGAILNVLSAMSWLAYDGANAYSASKAAAWSLTNGIRLELAGQGTAVTGLHLASTDTDMMAGWDVEKNDPADVVRAALDGIEAGKMEILADNNSFQLKAALSADPSVLYPQAVPAA